MPEALRLYSYWRSSAAYRVRIGLNLKRLDYGIVPVHLVRNGGEQHGDAYVAVNPQQLVPTLRHGERVLRQSLAILEYLDDFFPEPPLLPADAVGRQRARALAQVIACDVHPLNNLRVMQYLEREHALPGEARVAWMRHWMAEGFAAFEAMLAEEPPRGEFCCGEQPGLADACLVPQLYNAHRFGLDLAPYPRIAAIERACLALLAFDAARPENQPDAESV